MSSQLKVNDTVVSSKFGIGIIVEFEYIEGFGGECLSIQVHNKNAKVLIPNRESHKLRKVATPNELHDSIKRLSSNITVRDFESKKDRINFFKEHSEDQSLNESIDMIKELNTLDDRGSAESKILQTLIDSLANEMVFVLESEFDHAKETILNALGGNK
ncbi:CarD family transcriptional regulator [Halobacteriovorax sp. GB3]|uniref:CarD family transcriptional regulator n=1 Tax=Halobacteriovorax sp. GB3 TaxID=2719615 RepID=UPI00235EEA8F|nr:CarD family transcriptional regulator [Halobacteriovorax sp. GB3]MDD0853505.1 CarD family transcriptional regulator [Halobacteriovorax sp. GB3]